ncbi:MAG TPA: ABC transporter substrate-binding protein, partial [Candidatus Nitrosotenuis sp.]|nr:ABC transporter substrate-binding protein [Candidatus Nitrosotenuis sp.]
MKILKSAQILKSILGVVSFLLCQNVGATSPYKVVAITQIAPHPSLDQIRQGIEDELRGYDSSLKIIFDNANGKIETAMQIAQRFLGLDPKPNVVVPITTPSAQAICNTFKNSKIPIVFAAVSDPYRAKIVLKGSQRPITGLSDRPPLKEQLILIKALMPNIRKLGVLYNAGEDNSQATVSELKKLIQNDSIEIIEGVCNQTSEVSSVALNLAQKVDAIFIPNDNLV